MSAINCDEQEYFDETVNIEIYSKIKHFQLLYAYIFI